MDIKAISTLVVYIFMPCLAFRTLMTTEFNLDYAYMIGFAVCLVILTIITVKIYTKIRKLPAKVESGLILSTAFMNAGNYGSPIILFAYGQTAFDYAITYFVFSSILLNSIGLFYAARGGMSVKLALKAIFSLPMIYAVMLAALLKMFNLSLPENMFTMISFIANASIPCVMVTLGMQLSQIRLKQIQFEYISVATVIRLFIAPLFAFVLTQFFITDPLMEKVLILIAALPTATAATIFAVQFDSEPELVSGATLFTTLISLVTIAVLIAIMG